MSNRTPEPPDGSYGWLYGDDSATRPVTQVSDQLPPPNLPPPGRKARGGPKPPKPPKKRKFGRFVGLLLTAWLIFLIAVPIWAWSRIERVDAEPDSGRPSNQLGTNYLLVGSDSRKGLTDEQQQELATGGDSGGRGRTDTIMLMHVGSGPTLLMSIPRDSLVDIPGYGRTKVNAAFAYGGPELLVETIESNTGIRVDNFVEIGFGGLVKVVDAIGGIEICPKEDIKDTDAGLNLKAGCQEADGADALGYSRSRHTYATQDIQRVQSQREVLGAIASKTKSPWTFINPLRYFRTAEGASTSLRIGENVNMIDGARFAFELSSSISGKGLNCTVPLRDFAVTWDPERAPKMFDLIKRDRTSQIKGLCTTDGLPKG